MSNDNKMNIEAEVVFNVSDLRTMSVKSEETNEDIFSISGYGLTTKFNRDAINDIADVESLLDGIKELYRKMIMEDLIGNK